MRGPDAELAAAAAAGGLTSIAATDLTYMTPAAAAEAAAAGAASRAALAAGRAAVGSGGGQLDEPSKMAKRKHQITSLFHAAKAREAEYGAGRAAGQKSKAETAAKYGWV